MTRPPTPTVTQGDRRQRPDRRGLPRVHRPVRRLQATRAQPAGVADRRDRVRAKVGGHIYDRAEDGSECHWARVLAYEPPTRVVFSWDIGPTWQLETDPDNDQRGRGPLHRRSGRPHPCRARAPQPRPPWPRLGRRPRPASTRAGRSTSTGTPRCCPDREHLHCAGRTHLGPELSSAAWGAVRYVPTSATQCANSKHERSAQDPHRDAMTRLDRLPRGSRYPGRPRSAGGCTTERPNRRHGVSAGSARCAHHDVPSGPRSDLFDRVRGRHRTGSGNDAAATAKRRPRPPSPRIMRT